MHREDRSFLQQQKNFYELPVVNPEKIEDFKLEAEEEVQLELDI